nr:secretion protein F [Lachnospiraceae bacterium]
QMRSGKSEAAAYQEFGTRSGVARYNKLGSLLSQNLKKGSSALLSIMEYEARDAFEDRKAEARKLGEEAGTKLLLPMGMMLMVVMIIVIVPSVLSFGL